MLESHMGKGEEMWEWNLQDNFTANCVGTGVRWLKERGKANDNEDKDWFAECMILGRVDGKCLVKDSRLLWPILLQSKIIMQSCK